MDPISLIIAALAAGALAGTRETASQAIKDAYAGLKKLIRRRFDGNREAEAELDQWERQPADHQVQLTQHLGAVGADRDDELIRAAQAVLQQVDPVGARTGKYNVHITGGKGIVVGDASNVTMNFSDRD
jgi:hypothetical protein